jgi:hypothetical protein
MQKLFKIIIFLAVCSLLTLLPYNPALAELSGGLLRHSLETRYTVIRYQSVEDLEKFNRKIDYSPGQLGFMQMFSRSSSKDLTGEITKKVDAVYERVQNILGMRKKIKKITINIYSSDKQFHAVHLKHKDTAFRNFNTSTKLRAWYIHKNNTIYVNSSDLHAGMLAHEIAHAVIDHYLLVRPPRATAEILARYVDSHLLF